MIDWTITIVLTDVLGGILIPVAVYSAYAGAPHYKNPWLWIYILGFVLAWGCASHSQGLYERATMTAGRRKLLTKVAATCAVTFGLVMLSAFSLKIIGDVSRVWLLTSVIGVSLWIAGVRFAYRRHLETMVRRGLSVDCAMVLCGSMEAGYTARQTIERESHGLIRVVGIVPTPSDITCSEHKEIQNAIVSGLVDRVFLAGYDERPAGVEALLARLAQFAVDVTILPSIRRVRSPSFRATTIGLLPTIDVSCRPLTATQALVKRVEDLVLGGVFLALAAPVFLLIALAIKLDSRGGVFYRQVRLGFHDQPFDVWKFRTMTTCDDGSAPLRQTGRGDKRITRVGRFLRRTSLDELPQLLNVLRGDMSLVGPRPHAINMTTEGLPLHSIHEAYSSRHRIKPGITGWAQISGCRGEVATEAKLRQRVMLDCYYIDNWSFVLDLWIICRTVGLAWFDNDAY